MNLNHKNVFIKQLLKSKDYSTKITIYFSYNVAGSDYDDYEKNYTKTNLNPKTIKGYVSQISSEALVWKSYGLAETGAVEVICEKKYKNYFLKASRIVIDGDDYSVYISATGNKAVVTDRKFNLIRVVLSKKV